MREKPTDQQRLQHMLEAIDRIHNFTDELSYDDFANSEMVQFAVIKNFEIIGEAAYQINKELKMKYAEVQWKNIQGSRHILVHDYYRINVEIIWKAKDNSLTDLKTQIERILEENY
ncbi:MAG: DUF86 domain-containing protein [Bacteroidota bacterium]